MDPAAERKAIRAVDWLGVEKSHVQVGTLIYHLFFGRLGSIYLSASRGYSHRDLCLTGIDKSMG